MTCILSGYDQKNQTCYDAGNKKVLGRFEDEVDGKIMAGFLGLRSKCYAFKIHGHDEKYKTCKGTAKNFPVSSLHVSPCLSGVS